ncbi:MAG: lipase family protein [Gammaproteobacteria bacterium]|nr:lipase family protein [Gammaproteobacteria bacterium]
MNHFAGCENVHFEPALTTYSHANAWWLAEFCRLLYRIDDQLEQFRKLPADIDLALDRAGFKIVRILCDHATSTRAAVFTTRSAPTPQTLIVFCGTNAVSDWKMNIQTLQADFLGEARVHKGFKQCIESLAEELRELTTPEEGLLLAGHSLGAALASLTAVQLSRQRLPVQACYSFGSPRVGNQKFVELMKGARIYRLVNNCDIVTAVPRSLGLAEYAHGDGAFFFGSNGEFFPGVPDAELQERQLSYFPQLRKYADLSSFFDRAKALSTELPVYLADHAIVNYRYQIARQLASDTDRSP